MTSIPAYPTPPVVAVALLISLLVACGAPAGLATPGPEAPSSPASNALGAATPRLLASVAPRPPTEVPRPATSVAATPSPVAASPVEVVWSIHGAPHFFPRPAALAVDRQSHLYVIVQDLNRIQVYDGSGAFRTMWGSQGSGNGQFEFPVGSGYPGGVAVSGRDEVYVVDGHQRVQKFDRDGTFLLAWGRLGSGEGEFINPGGLAVDRQGHVYVADADNHRVQKFDGDGRFLAQWGGAGLDDGRFHYPGSVTVSGRGQVYVADLSGRIQKFDRDGTFRTAWGRPGKADGEFGAPIFLAVDGQEHVYAADSGNRRVQVFDDDGAYLAQWGRPGVREGEFDAVMWGIAVDDADAIYVVSCVCGVGRIQKFRPRASWPTPVSGALIPRPEASAAPRPTPLLVTPTPPWLPQRPTVSVQTTPADR